MTSKQWNDKHSSSVDVNKLDTSGCVSRTTSANEEKPIKPMTNRQWLESLSDEELAEHIDNVCECNAFEDCFKEISCQHCIVNWLQAEHKEEDDV